MPRFFAFLLAFMGAMTGVVLSGNLIQLVFFWELTSLFSFLLIGYWHHTAAARDGARMALTVTATGGLCLFAGVLVLGHIVGSYDLDVVLASGDRIRAHPLYLPALVLVLLGALTKSAQFPFHFWLPHAMAAPTPVSAYLHSATLVKAGVFLMARLWPVMAGTDAWFWIVGTAGLATLLLGAYIAIFQHDLKGLLAYSTISHLGLITLLLGLNSELAMVAAIFHIMNHAAFKASLFMAAGIIDHETGTRDIRRLSGLNRSMPFTARLALVAAAAMAGVPLLNGFLSKEMFFAEALSARRAVCAADRRAALRRDGGERLQRRLFPALHPRRLLRPATRWICRARRTNRRPGCASRWRSSCWPASWSASLPAADGRALPGHGRRAPCSARPRPTTAWRSGTASTCRC